MYPKVVRSLGDFFGSNPVEVQVLLLGLRGMEPYRRIPIANPCVVGLLQVESSWPVAWNRPVSSTLAAPVKWKPGFKDLPSQI
jgi:hypothetical protein